MNCNDTGKDRGNRMIVAMKMLDEMILHVCNELQFDCRDAKCEIYIGQCILQRATLLR